MDLRNMLDDGKPQSSASLAAAARSVNAVKSLEYPLLSFLWNAASNVLYLKNHLLFVNFGIQMYGRAGFELLKQRVMSPLA